MPPTTLPATTGDIAEPLPGHRREPLVSVVIPAYNRPEYLVQAIRSVLDQTVTDLEVLVADDASPRAIAPAVGAVSDERVSYWRNQVTLGVAANTRVAIARAQGRYLAILNDDDLWGPVFLERLIEDMDRDDHLAVAFCDFHVIDGEGRLDEPASRAAARRFGRDVLAPGRHRPIARMALVESNIPAVMCALFRREAIDWTWLPDGAGSSYDLWIAYLACRSGLGAYYRAEPLTYYRVHPGMQTHTSALANHLGRAYCYERFLEDSSLSDLHRAFRRILAGEYAGCGTILLRQAQPRAAREYLGKSLRLGVSPRALAALGTSLLPPSAASGAASAIAGVKGTVLDALSQLRPVPPRSP